MVKYYVGFGKLSNKILGFQAEENRVIGEIGYLFAARLGAKQRREKVLYLK